MNSNWQLRSPGDEELAIVFKTGRASEMVVRYLAEQEIKRRRVEEDPLRGYNPMSPGKLP